MDPVHFFTGLNAPLGFCDRLLQSAALQMEYLSRAALQGPAYLQHLAAHVDADQQAALPQALAQSLLPQRQPLRPRLFLGHGIAPKLQPRGQTRVEQPSWRPSYHLDDTAAPVRPRVRTQANSGEPNADTETAKLEQDDKTATD